MVNRCTPEAKQIFLDALRATYSVHHAARAAGICRSTAYNWRREDSEFAQAWEDALEDAVDVLEQSMFERALGGDTTAGIFLLKGMRPEKYKARVASEHSGELRLAAQFEAMSDEELERFARGEADVAVP